ncbi:hypothetical protein F5Y18DRAFT_373341 [Xylariaceae sp. FL1019]|nr:hypothetical protein F5Y18DRAFT_373341 [Xylariaceae sp. FL1019]
MMEYFTYKKVKKNREEKAEKARLEKEKEDAAKAAKDEAATSSSTPKIISKPDDPKVSPEGTPLLDDEDEKFLEHLTSNDANPDLDDDDEGTPPPLPPRVKTPVIDIESDVSSIASKPDDEEQDKKDKKGKGKQTESDPNKPTEKNKRFSFVTNLSRNISLRRKPAAAGLHPDTLAVPSSSEAKHEKAEMAKVLDDLNLSATDNRAFSLSQESAEMVKKFTQVLKDLVNGVPTAYGDLVKLLEDRDGLISKSYEKLPKSLKKLVAQLPEKLTGSLAPELLAVAAQAQGIAVAEAEGATLKGAAKSLLTPGNLKELVTKPGAVAGLLKGIVNALKTRFPAFIGTNVLWSLAVFLLLSMLWYCYKRGREVRLEAEEAEKGKLEEEGRTDDEMIEGRPRVEELPDDPLLAAPEADRSEFDKLVGKDTDGDVKGKGKEKEKVVVDAPAK